MVESLPIALENILPHSSLSSPRGIAYEAGRALSRVIANANTIALRPT
jgi:hypothetical protein